jgi:hypothetical protein
MRGYEKTAGEEEVQDKLLVRCPGFALPLIFKFFESAIAPSPN